MSGRTLHFEIPSLNRDEGILSHVDGLIGYLQQIKSISPLRARGEQQTGWFLYARTRTTFESGWEFLTLWTPKAVRQRQQVRTLIENAIKNIEDTNRHIRDLKAEILGETLAVKRFKEFDIEKLCEQLSALRKLADSGEQKNSNSPRLVLVMRGLSPQLLPR